jgi:ABC-2 type transport system permease protein
MKQLLHLLAYKIYTFFVVSFDKKPKTVIKNLAAGLIYFGFAFGMYKITNGILWHLLTGLKLNNFLFHRFISIILFVFFLAVNAGNIMVSLTGLFKSKEIDYLFTKPIPQENIFLVKFFDNFFYSSGVLILILFSVLLAYGQYFKLGFMFYINAIVGLFLPFTLIAAILGVLILFLLIRIASKIGVKWTIFILGAFYLISVVVFLYFNDPPRIIQEAVMSESYVKALFNQLDNPLLKYLPNTWVANSLYWFQRGETMMAFGYIVLLYAETAILVLIGYMIAKKYYYTTFILASEIRPRDDANKNKSVALLRFDNERKGSPVFWSIFRKEVILFLRDPAQTFHLLLMVSLMGIFVISIGGKSTELYRSLNPDVQALIYLVFFLFNSFFISSLALRFVFPHYSLEGNAFWKIRSAPVNYKKVYNYRFLFYLFAMLLLSEMLAVFSHTMFAVSLKLFSAIVTFMITVTVVSVNYGFGTYFANFSEKNPIRIASSQGASTSFLVCLFYLGFIIAVLFIPLSQYFIFTQNLKIPLPLSFFTISLELIALLSFVLIILTYFLGLREVSKDI